MKIPRMANAVGHIDDDLVAAAAESKKKSKHHPWLKWGSLAACVAGLVIVGAATLPALFKENGTQSGTDGRYKDILVQSEDSKRVWYWEDRTIYEKYTELTLDGVPYRGRECVISENLVGGSIGFCEVIGYDEPTNEKHTSNFEVYRLKYADQSQFVAVQMDGIYAVFKNDTYAPPKTLGELFDLVDFPEAIELSHFSENGESPSEKHYVLNDDDYVWDVLAESKNAPFVEDDMWTAEGREYLSFTINSETLGVYKVTMYVTEDGYLWTNAFDWQYLFHIGEETAEKVITYAKENSTETVYEPYQKSIYGKIIEITEEYLLVDDTILCKNSEDGMTYKVLRKDLRNFRYVDEGIVKVDDIIQVFYEGEIDEQNSNTIGSAISIDKVIMISYGDAIVFE